MKGYELHKSGARVNELLERHYIVPTLVHAPNDATLSWQDGDYVVEFRIGEMCRVEQNGVFKFYQLVNIADGKAHWKEDNEGGVEIVTEDRYEELKEASQIVPNVIYMVTNNDEPIALYVGTILIAQREEGSKGFTYNFPIIF